MKFVEGKCFEGWTNLNAGGSTSSKKNWLTRVVTSLKIDQVHLGLHDDNSLRKPLVLDTCKSIVKNVVFLLTIGINSTPTSVVRIGALWAKVTAPQKWHPGGGVQCTDFKLNSGLTLCMGDYEGWVQGAKAARGICNIVHVTGNASGLTTALRPFLVGSDKN